MQDLARIFTRGRLIAALVAVICGGVGTAVGYGVAWGARTASVDARLADHDRRISVIETDSRRIADAIADVRGDVRAILRILRPTDAP
jgi:hypothetical protein